MTGRSCGPEGVEGSGDGERVDPDGVPTAAVTIRRTARAALVAHARAAAPLECCGLLLAVNGVIEEAFAARNVRASATTFLVEPADHFAAIRKARAAGGAVIGAYHSHPRSPAQPSPTDRAEARDARWLHVIVSLADPGHPDVRAYRLGRDSIVEAPLVETP